MENYPSYNAFHPFFPAPFESIFALSTTIVKLKQKK
jgi:hypothetical protein